MRCWNNNSCVNGALECETKLFVDEVQYSQELHLANKKQEYNYGFIPYFLIKKIP